MSVSDTLIVWLKSLDEARYRELLAARPDALRSWQLRSRLRRRISGTVAPPQPREEETSEDAVPEPYELAGHLLERSSVIEALQRVSTSRLQVLEAVQVLGDGCRRHDLTALMDLPDAESVSRLDEVLDELAMIALIWPDGDRLRIGNETAGLETRIGGPLGAGLPLDGLLAGLPSGAIREIALTLGLNLGGAAHRDQLLALVSRTLRDKDFVRTVAAQAPARTGAILTRLASFGLPGVPGNEFEPIESRAIEWAAVRGLVILDGYRLAMPREVRLALRGAGYRAPFQPAPVRPATTATDPRPGDAANAAMRAVELTETILHACAATPPSALKSGGVGVRDLRRLAKSADCPVAMVRLLLEVAREAELIAWDRNVALPTGEFDTWLAGSTADRLGALLGAWWRLERLPLFEPEAETKPQPCLDPKNTEPYAPRLRAALVRTVAAVPPGRAVLGPDALVEGMLWWSPLTFEDPADAVGYAATVWEEAVLLGVVADGMPSPLAHGLVEGRAASSVGELFADEVTTALFQNDLTVVVTGLPSIAMSESLDRVADREVRGTASIWRFSPASVRRGFDQGLSARILIGELAVLSRSGELPNVLTHLIDDVARRHGEVRVVAAGCCLRVPEPSLAAELLRARGLAELRLREIAADVLVSALDPATTLTLLRQAGYVPAADAQDGTPFVDRSARRAEPTPSVRAAR
jgi:Helicase conserved C-terminal domain